MSPVTNRVRSVMGIIVIAAAASLMDAGEAISTGPNPGPKGRAVGPAQSAQPAAGSKSGGAPEIGVKPAGESRGQSVQQTVPDTSGADARSSKSRWQPKVSTPSSSQDTDQSAGYQTTGTKRGSGKTEPAAKDAPSSNLTGSSPDASAGTGASGPSTTRPAPAGLTAGPQGDQQAGGAGDSSSGTDGTVVPTPGNKQDYRASPTKQTAPAASGSTGRKTTSDAAAALGMSAPRSVTQTTSKPSSVQLQGSITPAPGVGGTPQPLPASDLSPAEIRTVVPISREAIIETPAALRLPVGDSSAPSKSETPPAAAAVKESPAIPRVEPVSWPLRSTLAPVSEPIVFRSGPALPGTGPTVYSLRSAALAANYIDPRQSAVISAWSLATSPWSRKFFLGRKDLSCLDMDEEGNCHDVVWEGGLARPP